MNLRVPIILNVEEKQFSDSAHKTIKLCANEFDFGSDWAESIGQGLRYSAMIKKKAFVEVY